MKKQEIRVDAKTVKVSVALPVQFFVALNDYIKQNHYYENIDEFLLEAARQHAIELHIFRKVP
jgi:hypothetical protein